MAFEGVRPSLTLDVPLETSLRVARQIARLGGFCEDSEGLPSRIVFYDAPVTRSEASSPRVGDDFRQRVTRALKGVGITTTEHLRVGAVKMGR